MLFGVGVVAESLRSAHHRHSRERNSRTLCPPPARHTVTQLSQYYPNGTSAEAPAVMFTSPPLVNPSGFTVRDRSLDRNIGGVDFQWNKVPGAVRYRITGTGLACTGVLQTDTIMAVGNTPSGPGSWQARGVVRGNVADTTTASWFQLWYGGCLRIRSLGSRIGTVPGFHIRWRRLHSQAS